MNQSCSLDHAWQKAEHTLYMFLFASSGRFCFYFFLDFFYIYHTAGYNGEGVMSMIRSWFNFRMGGVV